MNLFQKIKLWAFSRLNKKLQKKAIIEKNIVECNKLIKEFGLIQEKKSKLSRGQRDVVVSKVKDLIVKGHISVSK